MKINVIMSVGILMSGFIFTGCKEEIKKEVTKKEENKVIVETKQEYIKKIEQTKEHPNNVLIKEIGRILGKYSDIDDCHMYLSFLSKRCETAKKFARSEDESKLFDKIIDIKKTRDILIIYISNIKETDDLDIQKEYLSKSKPLVKSLIQSHESIIKLQYNVSYDLNL